MNKTILIILLSFFIAPLSCCASQEYVQKDGLFTISIPADWTAHETPGKVVIVPPPLHGGGLVIQFKTAPMSESLDAIKARINSDLEAMAEYKVKPGGGRIIENKEITIDHVYARCLSYTVSLQGEAMYFFRILFEHKGYAFSIDYGNPSKEETDKMLDLIQTLKF